MVSIGQRTGVKASLTIGNADTPTLRLIIQCLRDGLLDALFPGISCLASLMFPLRDNSRPRPAAAHARQHKRSTGRPPRRGAKDSAQGFNPGVNCSNGCALKVAPERGGFTGVWGLVVTAIRTDLMPL